MKFKLPTRTRRAIRAGLVFICALAIGRGDAFAFIWFPSARPQAQSASQTHTQGTTTIPAEQLDSLVAPIALYPDPLLAQTLAASTYPLELVQLQQWLTKNSGLTGQALADAVAKQAWDPSVQAMAAFPDVVKNMTENIQWTTDLGNAFLAQESGVMDAVQRMRARAQSNGKLESTPQQVVQTETVDNRPIIAIEQADPNVVYVPAYDPNVVYGAAPSYYPYPSESYPSWYSSSGFWTGAAIGFGTGIALGAWGGGGWGWRPGWGWGRGDIDINRNNNFVRNSNFYRGSNSNVWRHNAAHRGGVAYGNRATAARYGGTFAGAGAGNRAAAARQQINRQGGNLSGARGGAVGTSGRNFSRGNINRGGVNRAPGTTGNFNRGTGTSGRNFSGQRPGSANRGAVGTSGMTKRAPSGSFNRGGSSFQNRSGSVNRGNFSGNRGSFSGGSRSGSFKGGGGRSFGGGGRRGGGGGGGRRGGGGGRGRR
jgi:hypothetical protein